MINCKVCETEFNPTLEEGRPWDRYTHCDECYSQTILDTFAELKEVLET